MDEAAQETLRRAYHLIKAGEKDDARLLIKSVLAADHDNIDAWWLAAHAAVVPEDIRLALCRVLQLKPDHGPARLMLDRLNIEHPLDPVQIAKTLPPAGYKPAPPTFSTRRKHRWIWNVVGVFGCLGFWFASLALISSFMGWSWFDEKVEDVAGVVGVEPEQGGRGQFGTTNGGDPANPHEIPITQSEPIQPGDIMVGSLRADEAHRWTFSAQHGNDVAAMLQFSAAGDARHVMELRDAQDRKLADGVGELDSGTVTLVYTLTKSGTYSLVIIGRPNGPRGQYALGLEMVR